MSDGGLPTLYNALYACMIVYYNYREMPETVHEVLMVQLAFVEFAMYDIFHFIKYEEVVSYIDQGGRKLQGLREHIDLYYQNEDFMTPNDHCTIFRLLQKELNWDEERTLTFLSPYEISKSDLIKWFDEYPLIKRHEYKRSQMVNERKQNYGYCNTKTTLNK